MQYYYSTARESHPKFNFLNPNESPITVTGTLGYDDSVIDF